ncbi:ribbon-helix-helix protein, CopG family [Streptomyces glaucus]|uniref:Ribbon-helix-helix protein CopG domain-containing protein n=1 Tax=Streptomyces glaucus TaxID=284029 RepID=A0ABN3JT27_9ACTN
MDTAHAQALTVALTAPELDQVQHAAAAAGQSIDEFVRTAVLEAAYDPFLVALDQAADTIAARAQADRIQHDYAR